MTLFRQLLVFILVMLICLFSGFWLVQLHFTRNFLEVQLASTAQDTATSLGLSLSTVMREEEGGVEVESMVNAIFDRGNYQQIKVVDSEDREVYVRTSTKADPEVPAWFLNRLPIRPDQGRALIMDGWSRRGEILVDSHPGYGSQNLWRTAKAAAWWALGAFVVMALLGGLGLKILLRSLTEVEHQAVELANRRYQVLERIPRTRELKRVVVAMNTMTDKVRTMFEEQAAVAETLRSNAFQDQLTGMGNRRYFEGQLAAALEAREISTSQVFLMVQVENLQQLNDRKGYSAGDGLILDAAKAVQQLVEAEPGAVCGRISGSDFAVFLPEGEREDGLRFALRLQERLEQLRGLHVEADAERVGSIGGVVSTVTLDQEELMTRADEALRQAKFSGSAEPVLLETDAEGGAPAYSRTRLRQLLEGVLAGGPLTLMKRAVIANTAEREVLENEILSAIPEEDGSSCPAGLFIPAAERLELISRIDRRIVEQVLAVPVDVFTAARLTLNISPDSIKDTEFRRWLLLKLLDGRGRRFFNFEFPEFRIGKSLDVLTAFAAEIRPLGHQIGIDHFGQGLVHFGYLQSLQPDYVKIDRALTREMSGRGSDVYFFISSLCSVAHSLDIRVLVDGVITEEQRELLSGLPVDAVQGECVDRPHVIAPPESEPTDELIS